MIKLSQSNVVNNRIDKVTINLGKCCYKYGANFALLQRACATTVFKNFGILQ